MTLPTSSLRPTPEQFYLVCGETRGAVLELTADGRPLPMTATDLKSVRGIRVLRFAC